MFESTLTATPAYNCVLLWRIEGPLAEKAHAAEIFWEIHKRTFWIFFAFSHCEF